MNARRILLAFSAVMLGGCDLEEAGRLDLTRASSRGLKPEFRAINLDGGTDLALTTVLSSGWDPAGPGRWSLDWIDLGVGVPASHAWKIVGELDGDEVIQVFGSGNGATSIHTVPPGIWIERAGEVRLRLDSLGLGDGSWHPWLPDLPQRIRDDRPWIDRVFSFEEGETHDRGDTLIVAVHNRNMNAVAVYSDYSGVRQIGAYELLVPPGGRDTLRWLVVGASSTEAWIDLGWGDWGSHERRAFRIP